MEGSVDCCGRGDRNEPLLIRRRNEQTRQHNNQNRETLINEENVVDWATDERDRPPGGRGRTVHASPRPGWKPQDVAYKSATCTLVPPASGAALKRSKKRKHSARVRFRENGLALLLRSGV